MNAQRFGFSVVITTLAVVSAARSGFAQTGAEMASRRNLLEQAEQSRSSGNHAGALDLALRAGSIRMTPSIRMFIAQEQESVGRFPDALGMAELCVQEAEHDALLTNRDAIMTQCRAVMERVRGRIAYVTIHPPSPAPAALRVMINGEPLSNSLWGIPYAVTAGPVRIDASDGDRSVFHSEVNIAQGQTATIEVSASPVIAHTNTNNTTAGSPAPNHASTTTHASPASTTSTQPTTTSNQGSRPILVPAVLIGVGVVGFALAGVFAVLRGNALGNCVVFSDHVGCPTQADVNRAQGAVLDTTLFDVSIVVGGVAAIAGIVWFLVGPRQRQDSQSHARAFIAPSPQGMFLQFQETF